MGRLDRAKSFPLRDLEIDTSLMLSILIRLGTDFMDFPEMLEAVSLLREEAVTDRACNGNTAEVGHKVVLKA